MSPVRLLPHPTRLPVRAATGEVVLEATGLGVSIEGASILAGVDLRVYAGEVLALVGPNGAGKSTLLGTLAGDVTPAEGHVRLREQPIDEWSVREMAMRRAVLLQQVTVSFPFTVHEVVAMGRAPWDGTDYESDDEPIVRASLDATDVSSFAERRFNTLSGGERARAALSRVLAQDTGVLLLDEPTAALDLHHQELVMEVVRTRAAAGDAAVVVVHDLNLAAAHADRVAVLAAGHLVADGPPAEVLRAELLSRVYSHEIEVIAHPRTGVPLVLPHRVR